MALVCKVLVLWEGGCGVRGANKNVETAILRIEKSLPSVADAFTLLLCAWRCVLRATIRRMLRDVRQNHLEKLKPSSVNYIRKDTRE